MRSGSVTKYGERYPRSNCMPSTTSSVVSVALASSTVMTPSAPTFSTASATSSPMAGSLCAEIVATCAFSRRLCHRARHAPCSASTAAREPAVEAALQVDRARPGGDVAQPFGEDRVREERRGAGAVADRVAGPLGRLAQHARAEVLLGILELDLLGDRDAVVADDRAAPLLLDQDALRLGTEGDPNGVGERRGAAQDLLAGLGAEKSCLWGMV